MRTDKDEIARLKKEVVSLQSQLGISQQPADSGSEIAALKEENKNLKKLLERSRIRYDQR